MNQAEAPAFLLRLMQLSGYGLEGHSVLKIDEDFWQIMHEQPLSSLNFTRSEDLVNLNKTRYVCKRFLNRYLTYPLNTVDQLELTAAVPLEDNSPAIQILEPVLA